MLYIWFFVSFIIGLIVGRFTRFSVERKQAIAELASQREQAIAARSKALQVINRAAPEGVLAVLQLPNHLYTASSNELKNGIEEIKITLLVQNKLLNQSDNVAASKYRSRFDYARQAQELEYANKDLLHHCSSVERHINRYNAIVEQFSRATLETAYTELVCHLTDYQMTIDTEADDSMNEPLFEQLCVDTEALREQTELIHLLLDDASQNDNNSQLGLLVEKAVRADAKLAVLDDTVRRNASVARLRSKYSPS